jgi:hypothetical protein
MSTTILPDGATVVPVQRTAPRAAPLLLARPEPKAGHLAWEVLAAIGLGHVVPALFVNQFLVYFQLFSMPPALTPFHLGVHRLLVALGLVCVLVMAACGAARGGRWLAIVGGVVFAASVSLFRVQGAIPGF